MSDLMDTPQTMLENLAKDLSSALSVHQAMLEMHPFRRNSLSWPSGAWMLCAREEKSSSQVMGGVLRIHNISLRSSSRACSLTGRRYLLLRFPRIVHP